MNDLQSKERDTFLSSSVLHIRQILTSLSFLVSIFVKEYEVEAILLVKNDTDINME